MSIRVSRFDQSRFEKKLTMDKANEIAGRQDPIFLSQTASQPSRAH
jgi:hypothetical protein